MRQVRFSEEEFRYMKLLYKAGMSKQQICQLFDTNMPQLNRTFTRFGLSVTNDKNIHSSEERKEMKDMSFDTKFNNDLNTNDMNNTNNNNDIIDDITNIDISTNSNNINNVINSNDVNESEDIDNSTHQHASLKDMINNLKPYTNSSMNTQEMTSTVMMNMMMTNNSIMLNLLNNLQNSINSNLSNGSITETVNNVISDLANDLIEEIDEAIKYEISSAVKNDLGQIISKIITKELSNTSIVENNISNSSSNNFNNARLNTIENKLNDFENRLNSFNDKLDNINSNLKKLLKVSLEQKIHDTMSSTSNLFTFGTELTKSKENKNNNDEKDSDLVDEFVNDSYDYGYDSTKAIINDSNTDIDNNIDKIENESTKIDDEADSEYDYGYNNEDLTNAIVEDNIESIKASETSIKSVKPLNDTPVKVTKGRKKKAAHGSEDPSSEYYKGYQLPFDLDTNLNGNHDKNTPADQIDNNTSIDDGNDLVPTQNDLSVQNDIVKANDDPIDNDSVNNGFINDDFVSSKSKKASNDDDDFIDISTKNKKKLTKTLENDVDINFPAE